MEYKELLQLVNDATSIVKKTAPKKGKSKTESDYTVVYLDDYNLIIDNKRGDRLVFSPDKNEYTLTINGHDPDDLTSPSRGYRESKARNEFFQGNFSINNKIIDNLVLSASGILSIPEYPDLIKVMLEGRFTLKSGACLKYLSLRDKTSHPAGILEDYEPKFYRFFSERSDDYIWLCDNTSFLTAHKWNYDAVCLFLALKNLFGKDVAYYFAKAYTKSSVTISNMSNYRYDPENKLISLIHFADIKRVIDYMCFELYIQGVSNVQTDQVFRYMIQADDFNKENAHKISIYSENFASDYDSLMYRTQKRDPVFCLSKIFTAGDFTGILNGPNSFHDEYMIRTSRIDSLIITDKTGEVVAFSDAYISRGILFSFINTIDGSIPVKEMYEIVENANEYIHNTRRK